MAQSEAFNDASHALNELSHALALLESENNKLRELARLMWKPYCWAQSDYETCLTDDEDRAIRDKVRELGVEV